MTFYILCKLLNPSTFGFRPTANLDGPRNGSKTADSWQSVNPDSLGPASQSNPHGSGATLQVKGGLFATTSDVSIEIFWLSGGIFFFSPLCNMPCCLAWHLWTNCCFEYWASLKSFSATITAGIIVIPVDYYNSIH